MKSNNLKSISCLMGIGVVTLVSTTLSAQAEPPLDTPSIPAVEPTQPPTSAINPVVPYPTTGVSSLGKNASPTGIAAAHPQRRETLILGINKNGMYRATIAPQATTQPLSLSSPPSVAPVQPAAPPIAFNPSMEPKPTLGPLTKDLKREARFSVKTLPDTAPSSTETGISPLIPTRDGAQQTGIAPKPIPGTVATSADLLRGGVQPTQTSVLSSHSSNSANPTLAQTDLDIRRGTVGVPNYIGIGGNIGLSSGDDNTTIGDGGFVVNGKIGLASNLSLRPGVIFGNDATFLIPLTYDFLIPRVDPFEPIRFAPFAGGGVAITTEDDSSIGFLLTVGVDVPLSQAFVANASLNVGFIEDETDFGLILGVGYTFRNF